MNCRELDYRFEIDANIDSSHRGGLYIKEHLGFLQLINFLTCRVGVGVIFIKSTKSVNFNVKNAPNGWISWCRPTNV